MKPNMSLFERFIKLSPIQIWFLALSIMGLIEHLKGCFLMPKCIYQATLACLISIHSENLRGL